jgi:hypothetical protein
MRVLWLFALAAIVPAVFLSTRSSDALNPDIQNQFDLAIDTDVTGNSASSLGALDPCVAVNVDDTFEIDLIVRGVPEPGIAALAGDLMYDPAVLRIDVIDHSDLILDHDYIHLGNTAPDTDGDLRIDSVRLIGFPNPLVWNTGDGAILRLTFRALAAGSSTVEWDDTNPFGLPAEGDSWDGIPDVYFYDLEAEQNGESGYIGIFPNMRARGAEVVVGGTCPGNLLDGDGDGFSDVREDHVDTLVVSDCAATTTPNDETYDSWPPDFDDSQDVDISDVLALKPVFNAPSPPDRFDLVPSGSININDVLAMKPVFNTSCS